MSLSNEEIVSQQLTKARDLARNHQFVAAATAFQEILAVCPGHLEALLFMADHALRQGDAAQAVLLLERAT